MTLGKLLQALSRMDAILDRSKVRSCQWALQERCKHARRYCTTDSDDEAEQEGEVADLEDLAGPARRIASVDRAASTSGQAAARTGADDAAGPKEMLSPPLRAALGKQGYKLVGAHPAIPMQRPVCLLSCGCVLRPHHAEANFSPFLEWSNTGDMQILQWESKRSQDDKTAHMFLHSGHDVLEQRHTLFCRKRCAVRASVRHRQSVSLWCDITWVL